VRLAHGQPLGEREGIAGLDEYVETPALDLRALVEEGLLEDGGRRLTHGRNSSCCYRRTLLGVVRATFCKDGQLAAAEANRRRSSCRRASSTPRSASTSERRSSIRRRISLSS